MRRGLAVAALAAALATGAAPAYASTGCENVNDTVRDACYAVVAPVARYLCDTQGICIR